MVRQMAWFGAAVRAHDLQEQLGLSEGALDWWLSLASDSTPTTAEDFPGLDTLTHAPDPELTEASIVPGIDAPGDTPLTIRPGMWVQCDAGWGRIDRVVDSTGQPLPQGAIRTRPLRLAVTLRPDEDAEQIEIDLAAAEINFLRTKKVYTCKLCGQFSAVHLRTLMNIHSSAAHNGRIAFQIEEAARRKLTVLSFVSERPKPSQSRKVDGWSRPVRRPFRRR